MRLRLSGRLLDPDKPFRLQIGYPVARGTKPPAGLLVRDLSPLNAGTMTFTGPLSAIDKAYDQLIPKMEAEHLQPGDETREIYVKWEGPDAQGNEVVIAVGIKP